MMICFKMFSEAKIATANIPNLKIPISPDSGLEIKDRYDEKNCHVFLRDGSVE